VKRFDPNHDQEGRSDVVAAYRVQFAGRRIKDFRLEGLQADGGPSGRAQARYTISYEDGAKPVTGTMTWIVIRERDRPRISLIAARPE
jgi:hypothetical protein